MLGHWKNYDELESSLSFEELVVTLEAIRKKENKDRKFMAALQGIELEDDEDEVYDDITTLVGMSAHEAGFGLNAGLGYMEIGE